jgi:hypothetical protein
LRRAGKGYVLGVASTHPFNSWGRKPLIAGTAAEIAKGLDASAWQRLSAGEGTKGPRLYDWAYCPLADLDAAEYDENATGAWTRGLLMRRHIADGDLAFFSTWCPAGTDIVTLVKVEGRRWARPARGHAREARRGGRRRASRTVSRLARTSLASITTRRAPGGACKRLRSAKPSGVAGGGTDGIAMSRSSCWLSP